MMCNELTDKKKEYEFDWECNKFLENESEILEGDCFDQFLKSISLESFNQYVTKNKRIESFVQQVLDYFVRFQKEKSVDEINQSPQFLSYFRNRCIDEVQSYLEFQCNNQDYLQKLRTEQKKEASIFQSVKENIKNFFQYDSIKKIEKDFREMLVRHDITINNLGKVELPQKLFEPIECLSHFEEQI